MHEDLEKISMKKILMMDQITISSLEENLAERFNLTSEQLRNFILESETVEDLLTKINNLKGN